MVKLYVCSEFTRFDNQWCITIVLSYSIARLPARLLKDILLKERLVIMIQLRWAAAWGSIFLEKFAGTLSTTLGNH